MNPTIIIDDREKQPFPITRWSTITQRMEAGDYGIVGHSSQDNRGISIERKSIDDLVRSLTTRRANFERELGILQLYRDTAIIIEGSTDQLWMGQYRHQFASPDEIIEKIQTICTKYSIPIFFTASRQDAQRALERMIQAYIYRIEADYNSIAGAPEMGKRFTECNKWDDPWFRRLPPHIKCLWLWMTDRCSIAGIFELDLDKVAFEIGHKITENDIQEYIGDRIKRIEYDKYWIPKFVLFQDPNGLGNQKPAHIKIKRELEKYGLMNEVEEQYSKASVRHTQALHKPIRKGIGRRKGIGKQGQTAAPRTTVKNALETINED